ELLEEPCSEKLLEGVVVFAAALPPRPFPLPEPAIGRETEDVDGRSARMSTLERRILGRGKRDVSDRQRARRIIHVGGERRIVIVAGVDPEIRPREPQLIRALLEADVQRDHRRRGLGPAQALAQAETVADIHRYETSERVWEARIA